MIASRPKSPDPDPNSEFARAVSVRQAYDRLVAEGRVEHDPAQVQLAARLDHLVEGLRDRELSRKSSSLGWLFNRKRSGKGKLKGLYIHGKVGRGKSMMMDMFFAIVPMRSKRRAHFNEFMQDVHGRIHAHRQAFQRGETREEDPIRPVAIDLAREANLLCFDEFAVTDITDAMILGRLFSVLFEKGCVLVATSNIEPAGLYRDGLNRQLFLPFIQLLEEQVEIFELDSRTDFRLEKLGDGKTYLSPQGPRTEAGINGLWNLLTGGGGDHEKVVLPLKGRSLIVEKAWRNCAWLSFKQLCGEARGAEDYLALADRFDTVFIHGVPMMGQSMRNEAKRFILLIDTLYDRGIRIIVLAAANPHALYHGTSGHEVFEFQRTSSRLIEMQSGEYLARSGPNRIEK